MSITITEALAEIKTIQKRIDKKTETISAFLYRQEGVRDPLERNGGSVKLIAEERQAVSDLHKRMLSLRRGIHSANSATMVTLNGTTQSIADWLVWRRDVAPSRQKFLTDLRNRLASMRQEAKRQGVSIVSATATTGGEKPVDFVVNINEAELAQEIEGMEDILGQLDGQLSLKNATVIIQE